MFIDRDQILTRLDQIYKEGRPLCVSLYSRHGEGKSRLLREFSKGKKVLYYAASCVPWEENFQLLKDLCLRKFGSAFSSPEKFSQLLKMLKKESMQGTIRTDTGSFSVSGFPKPPAFFTADGPFQRKQLFLQNVDHIVQTFPFMGKGIPKRRGGFFAASFSLF